MSILVSSQAIKEISNLYRYRSVNKQEDFSKYTDFTKTKTKQNLQVQQPSIVNIYFLDLKVGKGDEQQQLRELPLDMALQEDELESGKYFSICSIVLEINENI